MTFNLHFSLCLRTWNFQELNIQYCRIMYSFYENNDAIYFIYGNKLYRSWLPVYLFYFLQRACHENLPIFSSFYHAYAEK